MIIAIIIILLIAGFIIYCINITNKLDMKRPDTAKNEVKYNFNFKSRKGKGC